MCTIQIYIYILYTCFCVYMFFFNCSTAVGRWSVPLAPVDFGWPPCSLGGWGSQTEPGVIPLRRYLLVRATLAEALSRPSDERIQAGQAAQRDTAPHVHWCVNPYRHSLTAPAPQAVTRTCPQGQTSGTKITVYFLSPIMSERRPTSSCTSLSRPDRGAWPLFGLAPLLTGPWSRLPKCLH